MAAAATLLEAATLAPQNLFPLWKADTLQAKVVAFWQAITGQFADQIPDDRPVGAWIAVIAAFAPNIMSYAAVSQLGNGTVGAYQTTVDYIYRLCKFAYYYNQDGHITNAQAAAVLAAYNAQFA